MAKKTEAALEGKKLTIGLPRALLYDRYRVLWKTFFRELGVEVVTSAPTTFETMNRGTSRAQTRSF